MYKIQKHISILLFMVFMGVQAVALHSFEHHDSDATCDLCLVMHQVQQQHFVLTDVATLPAYVPVLATLQPVVYFAFAKANTTPRYFFVRPPPVITC